MNGPFLRFNAALEQLDDLETTIADATPEELPALHAKLLALSDGLTEAIKARDELVENQTRLNTVVRNEYDYIDHVMNTPGHKQMNAGQWLRFTVEKTKREVNFREFRPCGYLIPTKGPDDFTRDMPCKPSE